MNFPALVFKEMRMLSRNLVFYMLIAVVVLFYGTNYATSESWGEGRAPVPPKKQTEQTSTAPAQAAAEAGSASAAGADAAAKVGSAEAATMNASPDATTKDGSSNAGAGAEAGAAAAKDGSSNAGAGEEAEAAAASAGEEAQTPADGEAPPADMEAPPPMPVYGWMEITDPGKIAERYIQYLQQDLRNGWMNQRIVFGMFAHQSKLSDHDRTNMRSTIDEMEQVKSNPGSYTAENVKAIAAGLDKKLGGWTYYMRDAVTFAENIETYEQAMEQYRVQAAEYHNRLAEGQVYPGMARLFCDYVGLTAGVFPVFLAAFALSRDRSSRMHELIASRRIRAFTYVGARFLAYAVMVSLVYMLLSVVAAWQTATALDGASAFGEALPVFLAYGAGWLLPTVWATTAFGMLVYTVFGSGIAAVPLQFAWFIVSVFPLMGDYRLYKLLIRFNTAAQGDAYRHSAGEIMANRIFMSVLALAMVAAASFLWERRRSSGRAVGRSRRRRGRSAAAAMEGSR
ncbi:ABC transporter permease [Paenibacillus sp. HN-1]|uniref:ABC transporter permease n=1 Tax=Paenibacillus TaxID=44249 RepID=UPI001CA9741E|nr:MULTISPECIES: ABC transporter permease [Paenibacillus]MBY9079930.1 ABC transporter permease [Paenibacillus sp. CGMCC 1.18879]MBY9084571.1 ABC transporter permease [Paenibacillus sinensis]